VNPYSHHSYFTVRALSRLGALEVLCPPLILQLWLHHWRQDGLSIRWSVRGVFVALPLSLFAYLLYSFRLIPEVVYLACFRLAVWLLLFRPDPRQIVYVYQDYLLPIMAVSSQSRRYVCEFIIQIPVGQPNRRSSLLSAQHADCVLAPTTMIQSELDPYGITVSLAPYGGDKACYRSSFRVLDGMALQADQTDSGRLDSVELLIAARSNTLRKGVDLLLESLDQLDEHWPVDLQTRLRVVICGQVSEPQLLNSLGRLQQSFALSQRISIRFGHLAQDDYLELLRNADLFIMPSRLEGSSPAALEALWLGVPSLLSPFCGVEAFKSGEHGLLIDPLSSRALQSILLSLLQDRQPLAVWRSNLQRDRQQFTWDGYMQAVATSVAAL